MKKIFYVLRPAMALRWLRMHPDRSVTPMNFPTLLAQTDLPSADWEEIGELLTRKAATREMGQGSFPPRIWALLQAEYDQAQSLVNLSGSLDAPDPDAFADAERLVRQWIAHGDAAGVSVG